MKNFIAALLVLTLGTITTFAAGPNPNNGFTGVVVTNIGTSAGSVSNNAATWPRITSGWVNSVSNQPPANVLVRLRTRMYNTNATPILIYGSSATNSTALYYLTGTNTLIIDFPLVDSVNDYYYSPAGGSLSTAGVTNSSPVTVESFGLVR